MGVSNLWTLLAPCGRRRPIESVARLRLAVDASIWLVQFAKAMRDERTGEMLRNAPLLGLFRRLCKLLYLKARPRQPHLTSPHRTSGRVPSASLTR